MKILAVSRYLPSGENDPGSPRTYCLLHELAREGVVGLFSHYVYEIGGGSSVVVPSHLSFIGDNCFAAPVNPVVPIVRKYFHSLLLRSNSDPRIRYPQLIGWWENNLRLACEQFRPDVVLCFGLETAMLLPFSYFRNELKIPVVVDLCDAMSLFFIRKAKQAISYKTTSYGATSNGATSYWESLLYRVESFQLRRLEQYVVTQADAAITISAVDRQAIAGNDTELAAKIHVIDNGIARFWFAPLDDDTVSDSFSNLEDAAPASGQCSLVFSGVMNYEPNADAAIFLANEVLPRVRREFPSAELTIVGSNPTPAVSALAEIPEVTVTGTVDDLRPYIKAADVFVSPLRFGAGVKNKILTAMAMRVPIVASPLSIEGIDVADNTELLVANTAEEFADRIAMCKRDKALCDRLTENAHCKVKEGYSWANKGKMLAELLRQSIY